MEGREAREGRDLRPAAPYREDCWSEGSTSALIEAWGHRYLHLNRGNLRHKDWQELADAVNSRRPAVNSRRPARTDSQCKNRIDTLKKKYKSEKARITDSGGSSQWPFFPRLDALIGNSPSPGINKTTPSPSPPLVLPLPSHCSKPPAPLPAARLTPTSDTFRRNYSAAAAAAAAAAEDSVSSASSSRERSPTPVKRGRADGGDGRDGVRQLAAAIERFAEVYEKVEEEKQRRVMELERKRMEFMKGVEFRRMQAFVDSQVQLERVKRARRGDGGEQASSALLSCLLQPCFFTA